MDFIQTFGVVVGLISAFTAVVSVIFAWKAVKETEHNNSIGLIVQLHSLYQTEKIFHATQTCWKIYNPYKETAGNVPFSHQRAMDFVNTTPKDSDVWKSVHELESFWRYIALLVRKNYLNQEIAFSAFSDPEILGLLFPIEKASVENYAYERSLELLYNNLKDWQKKNHAKGKTG